MEIVSKKELQAKRHTQGQINSVDVTPSLLEFYLRQLLYKTWNTVCCTLQLLYYNYFENRMFQPTQ